jgi:DnaJ-class molecular chaperone
LGGLMLTTRCECCAGKKTIIGLGCLIKDCPACKGVGHIKVSEPAVMSVASTTPVTQETKPYVFKRDHEDRQRKQKRAEHG